ncbi:MAG: hypothetical protein IPM21_07665 [Acidobacteria bacterium]|nr:hypothetical protein [Acidobacteriota bacterium]
MEILIVGSILVALMVWASTKIKRDAAAAYDEELIEGEGFTLTKPAGFIHMLNDDSGVTFRANSRDFGTGDATEKYQATIAVERHEGRELDALAAEIKESATEVLSDEKFIALERRNVRLELSAIEDDIQLRRFVRLAESDGAIFELRADVLEEISTEHEKAIENLISGFDVK